ncbi:MAG: helix-turn-helix transcriptional regulator [Pseudorhizobium sp.]
MTIDISRLQHASAKLSDVIADPSCWTQRLEDVATATGAMGAGLIPPTASEGAMATAHLGECLETYVREGWFERDAASHRRARILNMRGEVALDRDLTNAGGDAPFFDEFLPRFDGRWWAGIGFYSGPDLWSLTLHRSSRQGPFDQTERAILRQFSLRLNEVGSLAHLAGRVTLSAAANSFDQIGKAVVAIDAAGRFIHANTAAQRLLGASVHIAGGKLSFRDRQAAAEYDRVIDRLRALPKGKTLCAPPIVARRENAAPIVIRILPVDGEARSPFLCARALVLLSEIVAPAKSDWQTFSRAFGLTPAEARLAALLAVGESLETAAQALGVTRETARSRVKSIFQKTDTHRQGALVALLASFGTY